MMVFAPPLKWWPLRKPQSNMSPAPSMSGAMPAIVTNARSFIVRLREFATDQPIRKWVTGLINNFRRLTIENYAILPGEKPWGRIFNIKRSYRIFNI